MLTAGHGLNAPQGRGRPPSRTRNPPRIRRGGPTVHREKHFGAAGRGRVRVKSLKMMLEMLEQALDEE